MFFNFCQNKTSPAIIVGDRTYTYDELSNLVQHHAKKLPTYRSLIALIADNDLETLVTYLAALQQRHVILLLDGQQEEQQLQALAKHYQCHSIVKQGELQELGFEPIELDDDVALLLSTSGSTGTPKQVALSVNNLQSNAASICQYLPIKKTDTTITTLPFAYSYGLSVINSHLNAGASIVLNQSAMMSREFWEILDKHAVSSFAGVPFQYEMLMRLRLHQKKLASLRYITQAGGRLPEKVCLYLQRFAQNNHVSFYIMYGQTEATARMAFNQIEQGSKLDSIGKAIPNGQFKLIDESGADILEPHINGELCYSGPNIMLGYVEHYSELSTFTPQSWLYTGDVAYFDEDRDFFISGRLKRFIKVFGKRINLDELEQWLNSNDVKCYCIGDDELIQIGVVGIQLSDELKAIKSKVSAFLNVHHFKVDVRSVDELPIRSNGKKDYKTLACLLENGAVNP